MLYTIRSTTFNKQQFSFHADFKDYKVHFYQNCINYFKTDIIEVGFWMLINKALF